VQSAECRGNFIRAKEEGGIKATGDLLHSSSSSIHPSSFSRLSRVQQIQGSTDEGTGAYTISYVRIVDDRL
jgi:hypothetical protein